MGWVMRKTSGMFLVRLRILVRFDLCVEARFPYVGMRLLSRQIRQGMWREFQNQRGFLPVFEIKKGSGDLPLLVGGQLNCFVHLGSAEVRLRELLHELQMRTRWLQFAAIKAELVRC